MNKGINKMLGEAIHLAIRAHKGQYDKSGKPYILHPLHLMNQLLFDYELATLAILHDVEEDTDIIVKDEIELTPRILRALPLLKHNSEDTYEEYIEKICNNYDAIRVKRKDLEHNSDITRLKGVADKDLERIEKYHKAFLRLGEAKRKIKSIVNC